MPEVPSISLKSTWRRMGRFDRLLLVFVALYLVAWVLERFGLGLLPSGFLSAFISVIFVACIPYLLGRWVLQNRDRLLWSLRNRLVVAYVFIAVVPTLLVVTLGWLSARMFYQQVAAYLLYNEVQQKVARLGSVAQELVTLGPGPEAAVVARAALHEFPGLTHEFGVGGDLLRVSRTSEQSEATAVFSGLVQDGESVWMRAVGSSGAAQGKEIVLLSVPLSVEFADTLVGDLGPLQLFVTRLTKPGDPVGIPLGNVSYSVIRSVGAENREPRPPRTWLDFEVDGLSQLAVTCVDTPPCGGTADGKGTLIGRVRTRSARLNSRLFSQPGEVSRGYVTLLVFFGVLFFGIEVGALIAGIKLTRTITQAVAALYGATEHVQAGDLTHRVRTRERDQLGALGESFNAMIGSVAGLIEEQKRRQRLENELAIAQQVQAQLFPQQLPSVPRMELAAVCRAARVVSGDYYDFIPLGPNRLGIAIADISGKGISAALLMASLQAALRSQVLLDGKISENTDELVTRLNRHLFLNTSDERYATFFYAHYDSSTRRLHYTNAGHLPPIYVVGEEAKKLEAGGMVVGLFDHCSYERGDVVLEPGSVLVAYSDGLVEPENVYGEQFGIGQLTAEVVRHRHLPPQELAESLMQAVEEWAGTQEQADDMTVIVVKVT